MPVPAVVRNRASTTEAASDVTRTACRWQIDDWGAGSASRRMAAAPLTLERALGAAAPPVVLSTLKPTARSQPVRPPEKSALTSPVGGGGGGGGGGGSGTPEPPYSGSLAMSAKAPRLEALVSTNHLQLG